MQSVFELAAASVPGRDHLRAGRSCQDAFALWRGAGWLVAVVADGCGSSPWSELGARLGARLLAHELGRRLEPAGGGPGEGAAGSAPDLGPALLEEARGAVLARLEGLVDALGATRVEAVRDHLLFTLVGAAVGPAVARTFSLGDGLLAVDGVARELGPFEGNQPPYLAYALLPAAAHGLAEEALRFRLDPPLDARALGSLLLATDGALELHRREAAGALSRLWRDDRFFHNPDALRRHLWLAARDSAAGPGLLADDTTVVVLRRTAA